MIHAQNAKKVAVIQPVAILDDSSWTTVEIDRLGFDYIELDFILGATDIAITVLKIQESDTSGSGFADVTGWIYGTSTNLAGSTSTLPTATEDNNIFTFQGDLRPRKRYLDLVATIGDGTAGGFASALARLSRMANTPITAAAAGSDQILRI